MSKLNSPRDLLIEELKDLSSAESQLLKALPRMARAASSEKLKNAFETHLAQTEQHMERLETIMRQLEESTRGKKCVAMEGLIEEGKKIISEDGIPTVKDLALIIAAQKIEHYEIASYGCARTLAELVGEEKIATVLQETLDEEGETDKLLTDIALELNVEASVEAGQDD